MNDGSRDREHTVPPRLDEKDFRRQNLAEWDRRWHRLSVLARYFVLHHLTAPVNSPASRSAAPTVSTGAYPRSAIEELRDAGFVEIHPGAGRGLRDRVVVSAEGHDFALRAHTLRRFHLLDDVTPSKFAAYVSHAYSTGRLTEIVSGVLRAAGIDGPLQLDDSLNRYVTDHRWPGWVVRSLNEPLADRILHMVLKSKTPIPVAELLERIEGSKPYDVRLVADKLVARLALVEDIRSSTWELVIGIVPAVREKMTVASMPRERPPLLACESPKAVGPEGSPIVNDMRAVLIEVASQPPRLRQDLTLFHKEVERFQAALDPLARWLLDIMKWTEEGRLNRAMTWARALHLARVEPEAKQVRLVLTPDGEKWLSAGAADGPVEIYRLLSTSEIHPELFSRHLELFLPGMNPWETVGPADVRFLGSHVVALKLDSGKRPPHYLAAKPEDHLALRKQLDVALTELEPDVFFLLESVESHLVYAEHNPLNRGLPMEQVAVFWVNRPVSTTRLQREEIGRLVIKAFVLERLVPFGCVRAAIDEKGRICVARGRRYDAYFGREVARPDPAVAVNVDARVVVQPDFSVMVIGPNPARAAELAPFCERTTRGGGQGAMVLKITRDSVVKAVKNGLTSSEIVARLERHASNGVPANVLRQVQDWSTWVRRVTSSPLVALRCPDSDTADRVMAAMKRQAERVNSTLVAIDLRKLTTVERNKLQEHGILVDGEPEPQVTRSKGRKKR